MAVVFWDFDGTLVYSTPLWSNSVYSALKSVDCDTSVEFSDLRNCMATGFTWHTPENDYSEMTGEKWWDFMINKICNDYISLGVNGEDAQIAASRVPDIIKNTDNYILFDDTVSVLEKTIEKGYKNVLLSNNYPDLSDVVDQLGLSEYFDDIIVSSQIGYDKPRKEIFDYAKSKYPNEQYIMIGDNVIADIAGGNNAGMKTVLIHRGFNSSADICCDNLSDIDFDEMEY